MKSGAGAPQWSCMPRLLRDALGLGRDIGDRLGDGGRCIWQGSRATDLKLHQRHDKQWTSRTKEAPQRVELRSWHQTQTLLSCAWPWDHPRSTLFHLQPRNGNCRGTFRQHGGTRARRTNVEGHWALCAVWYADVSQATPHILHIAVRAPARPHKYITYPHAKMEYEAA
jgi:hypothetical protein